VSADMKSAAPPTNASAKRKLSYKEQKELEGLPALIESLEAQIAEMHTALAAPDFYKQSGERITAEQSKLKSLDESLAAAYTRWENLEQGSS
jgi:ATP-binding cassette subfamily F protein uup